MRTSRVFSRWVTDGYVYLTELVGLGVYDLKGRRIGTFRDAALVPLIDPVRLDRYLVGAGPGWLSIRYDQVKTIGRMAFTSKMSGSRPTIPTNICCAWFATCWTSRSSTPRGEKLYASMTSPS